MNVLPEELLRSIELARPAIVEWILPALVATLGMSIGVRGVLALRRLFAGRCPRCGHVLHRGGLDSPPCCTECGEPCAASGAARERCVKRSALMIMCGVAACIVVLHRAMRYDATAPIALIFSTSGIGAVAIGLTIGRRPQPRGLRRMASLVVALLLQAPWIYLTFLAARTSRAEAIAAQWRALGIPAWASALPGAPPDPLLAWMPERWQYRFSASWVLVGPPTNAAMWATLPIGPVDCVVMVCTGVPGLPSPTADEIRAFARFPLVTDVYLPRVIGTPDRIEALRGLPARYVVGGYVVDDADRRVGRLIDTGADVRVELDGAP
ncbi:MAG: hypothetical protein U0572_15800 [Phycisphaerales bacterium]